MIGYLRYEKLRVQSVEIKHSKNPQIELSLRVCIALILLPKWSRSKREGRTKGRSQGYSLFSLDSRLSKRSDLASNSSGLASKKPPTPLASPSHDQERCRHIHIFQALREQQSKSSPRNRVPVSWYGTEYQNSLGYSDCLVR